MGAEDWFELYSDEPTVGELAIFWDSHKKSSRIRIYAQLHRKPCAIMVKWATLFIKYIHERFQLVVIYCVNIPRNLDNLKSLI